MYRHVLCIYMFCIRSNNGKMLIYVIVCEGSGWYLQNTVCHIITAPPLKCIIPRW